MKTFLLTLLVSVCQFFCVVNLAAQSCVDASQTKAPWTNIPYFDGSESYINLSQDGDGSADDWLIGSFSFDTWVRCTWPDDASSDGEYFVFGAGAWDDDYNSLFLLFQKVSTGHWRLRISDGDDSGSNADMLYDIDYEGDFQYQWVHLTVTYDDEKVRLYINGSRVRTTSFVFNRITDSYCVIGGHSRDHSEDFRGEISGFRFWKNRRLTAEEIDYVWDRTFDGEETFNDDWSYLYKYLLINMYTGSDNIYSLVTGQSMVEHAIERKTDRYHPGKPINASNLQVTGEFDRIKVEWDSHSSYNTNYVYRRDEGATSWILKCRTQSTYYYDYDVEGGKVYDYLIRTYSMVPGEAVITSGDYIANYNTPMAAYNNVTGLIVTDDANTNCDGTVRLKWNAVSEPSSPPSYTLYARKDGGSWDTLSAEQTALEYVHYVDPSDLGKTFEYRVDANGDDYENYSDIKSAQANTECTTAPENVAVTLDGDNFVLNWDFTQSGAPATAFRIYRKVGSGEFEELEAGISIDERQYIDKAASCTDYTYKVEAYNPCGANGSLSAASAVISKTIDFNNVFTYTQGGKTYADFDASKGYYSTKVLLEWAVNPDKQADIVDYEIYRRKQNQTYSLLATMSNPNASYYEDMSTEANVFYQYKIRAKAECNNVAVYSDTLEATGFRYSSGIVSGKVTYAGGNAVEGVEVRVATDENVTSGSLYFDGVNDKVLGDGFADDSLFHYPLSFEAWIKPELMITGERNIFFSVANGCYYVGLQNMKPIAAINQHILACSDDENPIVQLEGDTALIADTWYHIATTLDPDSGIFRLYLNGEEMASSEYSDPQLPWGVEDTDGENCGPSYDSITVSLGIGRLKNTMYKGHLDEVRMWKCVRSPEEVARDYTRLLTGSEDGLVGYYRLDENYGYGAFDLSRVDNVFNKNDFDEDGAEDYWPDWSSETPSFEQLHPSAVTDQNGNYVVKGIRYSGNGNVFNVSPFLGIHEFNPTDVSLYVGDGDPVHNGVDFVDQSAFTFTGNAYYKNTNVPVVEANVYIDNVQQFDAGGKAIQTNAYGQLELSVPIGQHFITLKKDGHTFASKGQWPVPVEDDQYPTFDFQDDVDGVTFDDLTKVKVAGRFVGGDSEGNKDLGLGLSTANIGSGRITLINEAGYDIDTTEAESSMLNFTTDPETGEYMVELLPIVYKIDSAKNDYYEIAQLDLGNLDLTEIPELTTVSHTSYEENIEGGDTTLVATTDSASYHFVRNFIYYEEPTIYVGSTLEDSLVGEKEYITTNPNTEEKDTIDLLNNSPFNYPIFNMGTTYDIAIRVEAFYKNYDKDAEHPVVSTVPVQNAELKIVNNLEIKEPTYTFKSNEDGVVEDYTAFKVGLPNMAMDESNGKSFTKTLTITADAGNFSVAYNGGEPYRAYVLGGVDAGGSNYVTYGPEIVEFILRDPPGDASYTELLKGSMYTSARDYSFNMGGSSVYDNVLMRGVKFELGGGLAGPVFTSEVQTDLNLGISTTQYVDRSGEYSETYEFNETFSTSAADNAVGSNADVYIGKSLNLFFTETQNLRIYPASYCDSSGLDHLGDAELADANAGYNIGKRPGFAVTEDPSSTMFVYSQDYILNSLLPTYRELIYNLLGTSKYESKIPSNHIYYGIANNSAVWKDTIAATGDSVPSYIFHGEQGEVDSVAFLNQQIGLWLQTIALNEAQKVKVDDDYLDNVSFDGNAGAYSNEVSYSTLDVNEKEYFYRFELFGGSTTGFSINGTGLMTYSQTYKNADQTITERDAQKQTMKWRYVLDDSQQGDYYSVDISRNTIGNYYDMDEFLNANNFDDAGNKMSKLGWGTGASAVGSFLISSALTRLVNPLAGQAMGMVNAIATTAAYMSVMGHYSLETSKESVYFGLKGASPIFKIQGGQSRCPYEGPEYSSFYGDTTGGGFEPYQIHVGTQNHEQPKIQVDPPLMVNIPDGEAAVFEIKLINESPTDADLTYALQIDEASNPDGAVIKVDGIYPNRDFFVAAGQTLTKTLTVERGSGSVMDYDDLQLIFHSSCQYNPDDNFPDIADTVSFSAHFVPVCTEAYIDNMQDGWVINKANNNQQKITVSGYNTNLSTFEKIYCQYQKSGSSPTTNMVLYNDTTNTDWSTYSGHKMYIDNKAEVSFYWDVESLNDGEYTLMLTTTCSDGSTNESGQINGVIDRISPSAFGAPSPSDGILSYGEDIVATFNEDIDVGDIQRFGQYGSRSYISVRGRTNGEDLIDSPTLLHDASVHFDGVNDYLRMDHVNLDYSDFTIAFWAKRASLGAQTILTLGKGALKLGFDASNKFTVGIDQQTIVSKNAYTTLDEWMFFSVSYTRGDDATEPQFLIQVLNGNQTDRVVQEADIYSSLEGVMYVGASPEAASAFAGNIHELRLWNYYRTSDEINAHKGQLLSGYEEGLYGLWPLNEARGDVASDIAFGRNAQMKATWQVSRNGKAVDFNGHNYFEIPTGSMAFDAQTDFTIEFWFKMALPDSLVTLLSNGNAEVLDSAVNVWNVAANPEGQLIIQNNEEELTLKAEDYLDDNWHHFAMSLNRIGYLSLYLDGELKKTSSVGSFGGFGASQLVAGARWYNLSMLDHYDRYMTGKMDEIRVWNAARTQSQIQRYMNCALRGDEMGLKAYFPFEDVTIEDPGISNESADNFTLDSIGIADDATLALGQYTSESPNIKLQSAEVLIPHQITISDNAVLVDINKDAADIENQIYDISVMKIKDLNNNVMPSTLTWTVFVDNNNVVWDLTDLSIDKFVEDESTMTVKVRNNGGGNENFEVTNIPSWMSVKPEKGYLAPLEEEDISITVGSELNIGHYQRDLNLVASMGYKERLSLDINVEGHAPSWSVDPEDYVNSANVIAQLSIDNEISTDEDDILACFINDACRGVANIQYFDNLDAYLCFMNVYADTSGAQMTFKVYDASTGDVCSRVLPNQVFEANKLYGTLNEPLALNATNYVEQSLDLASGWNWVSFNVTAPEYNDLDKAFEKLNQTPEDAIKNRDYISTVRNDYSWFGTVPDLDVASMYKLKVQQAQDLVMEGYRVVPDTLSIPIVQGWNWISYPLSVQKTLKDALSSLSPEENDLVKSQSQFAVYSSSQGWIGSLNYMVPGKGYMLYSSVDENLDYSSGVSSRSAVISGQSSELPMTEHNMSIIASVGQHDVKQIKAYDSSGLCGVANPVQCLDGTWRYFLSINSKDKRNIRFEMATEQTTFEAKETVSFDANALLGTLSKPYGLTVDRELDLSNTEVDLYPNPFVDQLMLSFNLDQDEKVEIALFNVLGAEVAHLDRVMTKGRYDIDLLDEFGLSIMNEGVYLVQFRAGSRDVLVKAVKE